MNERDKQILKEILKESLTVHTDPDGTVVVCFDGEVICVSEETNFNGELV